MDRGAWRTMAHRVSKNQTHLRGQIPTRPRTKPLKADHDPISSHEMREPISVDIFSPLKFANKIAFKTVASSKMVETHPEPPLQLEPMALNPALCPGPHALCSPSAQLEEDRFLPLHLATLVGWEGFDLAWELSTHASEMVEKPKLSSEKSSP